MGGEELGDQATFVILFGGDGASEEVTRQAVDDQLATDRSTDRRQGDAGGDLDLAVGLLLRRESDALAFKTEGDGAGVPAVGA